MTTRPIRQPERVSQSAPAITCAWRTGVHACKMIPTSGRYCAWHAYWMRLVDAGSIGRQQHDEFCEWWEQFQPYGIYSDTPGQWWAAVDVLWLVLTGLADKPVMTEVIAKELFLRRAEVRHYQQGLVWGLDPWPRLHDAPLPQWIDSSWQKHANRNHGSSRHTKQCG